MLCCVFGMHYIMSFLVLQLCLRGRVAGCVACIVFWMSCYCKCPVALPAISRVVLQFVNKVFPDHTHSIYQY